MQIGKKINQLNMEGVKDLVHNTNILSNLNFEPTHFNAGFNPNGINVALKRANNLQCCQIRAGYIRTPAPANRAIPLYEGFETPIPLRSDNYTDTFLDPIFTHDNEAIGMAAESILRINSVGKFLVMYQHGITVRASYSVGGTAANLPGQPLYLNTTAKLQIQGEDTGIEQSCLIDYPGYHSNVVTDVAEDFITVERNGVNPQYVTQINQNNSEITNEDQLHVPDISQEAYPLKFDHEMHATSSTSTIIDVGTYLDEADLPLELNMFLTVNRSFRENTSESVNAYRARFYSEASYISVIGPLNV